jgi:hypothetical protein
MIRPEVIYPLVLAGRQRPLQTDFGRLGRVWISTTKPMRNGCSRRRTWAERSAYLPVILTSTCTPTASNRNPNPFSSSAFVVAPDASSVIKPMFLAYKGGTWINMGGLGSVRLNYHTSDLIPDPDDAGAPQPPPSPPRLFIGTVHYVSPFNPIR